VTSEQVAAWGSPAIGTARVPFSLVIPQPPSVNEYWKPWRSRMVMTPAGRAFRKTVWAMATAQGYGLRHEALAGDVIVYLAWHRKNRNAGDIDNRVKPVLDALQGVAYSNDKQVAALVVWRVDGMGLARVEVRVEPWMANRVPVVTS